MRLVTPKKNKKLENFEKMFHSGYVMLRIKDKNESSVDPDKMAHNEPPHLDLHCLQSQPFSVLTL